MPDQDHVDEVGRTYAELLGDATWGGAATTPPQDETSSAPPSPLRIIEAMLFIGGDPLTTRRACEAIRGLSAEQFEQAIAELTHAYRRQNRPYAVVQHDQGHILA